MAHSGFTPYSHRDFIKQLRQLLQDRYTWDGDGFSILKELIQNANDAGATRLDLGWIPAGTGEAVHPLLGSAALFAVNDGPFHPSDASNITRLGSNSKAGESTTAGRFGLGLKSVFHLCEAFFYLASSCNSEEPPLCRIFNPWSPQPNDEPSPYEHWDFDTSDERARQIEKIVREQLGPVLETHPQFFCLWIPLRDTRILDGKPSIVPGDFDESRLQSMIGHETLGTRLAELVPYLHSLQTIRIWSPQDRTVVEHLTVQLGDESKIMPRLPDIDGAQFPKSRKSVLKGTVAIRPSEGPELQCDFVGRESIPQSESLETLWSHPVWPKDESLDPKTNNWREHRAKMVPHGAVRFMASPVSGRIARLSMQWCVFLPLGSATGEEHDEIGTSLPADISLFLHGYFFVDSGRKRHVKTRFQADQMRSIDVEHLQQEWNAEIEADAVWPFLLESLEEFVTQLGWNDHQIKELTRSLRALLDRRGGDVVACVAAKKQWLYVLTPHSELRAPGQWQLKPASASVIEIPQPPASVTVSAVLPGVTETGRRQLITIAGFPTIAARDPSEWSPDRLKRLLQTTDIGVAFSDIDNLRYIADLVSHCSATDEHAQAAGEALWPILKKGFQSPKCDFTLLRHLEEPLVRLLSCVPEEHRLNLPWATDERTGSDGVFRVIAAANSDILPIPSFLKPPGRDCRRIESRFVIEVLEQVVDLSLDRSLLADVVGDLLDRADLDRESLSSRLSPLRLVVVSNLQLGQTQRVTWQEAQAQRRSRMLFCDQAGLTKQFQSALGPETDVWRIDPEFARRVLGEKHQIPGCSARECARILSPSRESNVNHIPGPDLGNWDDRRSLLESLTNELGRVTSQDQEHLKYACRLLLHGRTQDAGFNLSLFLAGNGAFDCLAEKLCRHILNRRTDPHTRSHEEWRIVDGERASWISQKLNQEQLEALDIVDLKFGEPAVLRLIANASPDQLAGVEVTDDEYGILLETLSESNPDIIKRLPIHTSIADTHVVIESGGAVPVYWDNGYRLDGELQRSAMLLRMHKDQRIHRFQLKLADPLGPQQIAQIVLQADAPERHWRPLLRAIGETDDRFSDEIMESIRNCRWYPTTYGPRSCDDLICLTLQDGGEQLPGACVASINQLVDDCEAAYLPEWLLDESLRKELQRRSNTVTKRLFDWQLLPDTGSSLSLLGLLLGESPDNYIGYLSCERFEEWLTIEWAEGLMPVHGILKAVATRFGSELCYTHATAGVREPLGSVARLVEIVLWLAESHESADTRSKRATIFGLYQTYLGFLLSHPEFEVNRHLRLLQMLSQNQTWNDCTQLCFPPAAGISRNHVLDDSLSALLSDRGYSAASGAEHTPSGTSEQVQCQEVASSPNDSCAIIERYFRGWEGSLPNDVIGGFIGLLGGDPQMEELANRYLGKRSLDETRRNLHITPSGIGPRQVRMKDQRVNVVLVSEQSARATNLLGEQFTVPLVSAVESLLVGFGTGRHVQVTGPDQARTLTIQLRPLEVAHNNCDADSLTRLLADAAEKLLVEGLSLPPGDETQRLVQKTFEDLRESDQLEIRITQQLILEDAEFLLGQLGLQSDRVFGPLLAELTKHKRLRAERDHNEKRFQRKSSWTESEIEEEHNTPNQRLRELLERDGDGQHRVLMAVRNRIQGHNQYNAAAIPFELFQNADDACEERKQLLAGAVECDTVRYFIDDKFLAIQHCGRCVNQVPPGEDPRTHKLSDDLRKMVTLWLSSKDAVDTVTSDVQLTGKFGLGFKSVFLVSDRPTILSGRIACEIVGGVFPKYLSVEEQLRYSRYSTSLTEDARREVTVIALPLADDDEADSEVEATDFTRVSPVVDRFIDLAHLLVVFSRQLRRIEVHIDDTAQWASTSWHDTSVPGVTHCFKGSLAPLPTLEHIQSAISARGSETQRALVLRCVRHSGALVLRHDGRKFLSMPDEVPTLWVTAPTQHCLRTGFVLNAAFSLDPGRAQLGRESPENERIARDLGRELGERLVALFKHSSQVGWRQFCADVGLDPAADEHTVWDSLWDLLGPSLSALPASSDAAVLLRQVFWGEDGAAERFYKECAVLPSRLKGASFRDHLSTLSQIKFSVSGVLSSDDG